MNAMQPFIKDWLLQKKKKVYSIIADTYREELIMLKPTLFRAWLAKEIDIPEEKINVNSLASVLSRLKNKTAIHPPTKNRYAGNNNTTAADKDFHFTNIGAMNKNTSGITES